MKLRHYRPFEQRRLRILNALAFALVRAGAKVDLRGKKLRDITIRINDSTLHVALEAENELAKGHDDYTSREIPPNAPLVLAIFDSLHNRKLGQTWHDGEDGKLAGKLSEIAVALFVQAEADYRGSCEWRHQSRIRYKAERIKEIRLAREKVERQERERQERLRQARIDRLLGEADAFHQAQAIRNYVESARANMPSAIETCEFEVWAGWALGVADTVDPVTSGSFVRSMAELNDETIEIDQMPDDDEELEY